MFMGGVGGGRGIYGYMIVMNKYRRIGEGEKKKKVMTHYWIVKFHYLHHRWLNMCIFLSCYMWMYNTQSEYANKNNVINF